MIVMKFGGSSVKNAERITNVGTIIKSRLDKKPIVVVSALGGITDMLIGTAENAFEGKDTSKLLAEIRERHTSTLKDLGLDESLVDEQLKEFEELIKRIEAVKEITTETMDHIQSFGERMSARIVAAHLSNTGTPAEAHDAYDVGFISDDNYGDAEPLEETEAQLREHLTNKTAVPVITGFIAKTKAGKITTLGRGGSDYTAAIIGAAVNSEEIQIWTDVNGIMTTDPRIVKEAKTISEISFNEASELAYFGAKVLHPKTIIPAVEKNIPVRVLNTYEPDNEGTVILKEVNDNQPIKAIACKRHNLIMNITSSRMLNAYGFLTKVFSVFEKNRKSVDMISTSEVSISLTLSNDKDIDKIEKSLKRYAEIKIEGDKSIICIVGDGMKHIPGIAAKTFSVLGNNKINVEMISQGASEINISFVVNDVDADNAIKALHKEYFG
ncbi:MAG: lysine-sensitive aspartokinase 3 [Nanoarchaeota archaeon]